MRRVLGFAGPVLESYGRRDCVPPDFYTENLVPWVMMVLGDWIMRAELLGVKDGISVPYKRDAGGPLPLPPSRTH